MLVDRGSVKNVIIHEQNYSNDEIRIINKKQNVSPIHDFALFFVLHIHITYAQPKEFLRYITHLLNWGTLIYKLYLDYNSRLMFMF